MASMEELMNMVREDRKSRMISRGIGAMSDMVGMMGYVHDVTRQFNRHYDIEKIAPALKTLASKMEEADDENTREAAEVLHAIHDTMLALQTFGECGDWLNQLAESRLAGKGEGS